jgi:hypothetical protein
VWKAGVYVTNLFTGEHSVTMINLDNVEYAICSGPGPGPSENVRVVFRSGREINLKHGDASMFRQEWLERSNQ